MYRYAFAAFVGLLLAASSVSAQEAPDMKYGRVSAEELQMAAFPPDPDAAAVVLFDFGDVYFDHRLNLVFERHRRIKILDESAFDDWGTFELTYYRDANIQKLDRLDAMVYNVGPNGKTEKIKVDKRDMFDEKVSGRVYKKKFTYPDLRAGTVIEYRYKLTGMPGTMPGWTFQSSEPVLWSEFRNRIPTVFRFQEQYRGKQNFAIRTVERDVRQPGPYVDLTANEYRWAMANVPALRTEAYMASPKNYRASVQFHLTQIDVPGQFVQNYVTSWEKIAEDLLEDDDFGRRYRADNRAIGEKAAELTAELDTDEAKLVAIHDWVRDELPWDGNYGSIWAFDDLDGVFEEAEANQSEKAHLLVAMLRKAGIDAHPVLVSTRANGIVTEAYPSVSNFNYVLVQATTGDTTHLLDPTDRDRPYTLLPQRALNHRAFIVTETPQWIGFASQGAYKRQTSVTGLLATDGSVTAKVQQADDGYAALDLRHTLRDADDRDVFVHDDVLGGAAGMDVAEYTLENEADNKLPLVTKATVTANAAQAAGAMMYLNPYLVGQIEENPFQREEREYPVDFTHPEEHTYTAVFTLPDGYRLQEAPENIRLTLLNDAGEFIRMTRAAGNQVQVITKLAINRTVYTPNEYTSLRDFYSRVIDAQQEQLVLTNAPAEPATPAKGDEGATGEEGSEGEEGGR